MPSVIDRPFNFSEKIYHVFLCWQVQWSWTELNLCHGASKAVCYHRDWCMYMYLIVNKLSEISDFIISCTKAKHLLMFSSCNNNFHVQAIEVGVKTVNDATPCGKECEFFFFWKICVCTGSLIIDNVFLENNCFNMYECIVFI
jgi:hypothetical protein